MRGFSWKNKSSSGEVEKSRIRIDAGDGPRADAGGAFVPLAIRAGCTPHHLPSRESIAIVLAGPDGIQKTAQTEFLRQRYRLREIADRHLQNSPWDVYLIESYNPDADVWTLDGTRPPQAISETLQRLLDGPAGK